jgi:hypothetical protein
VKPFFERVTSKEGDAIFGAPTGARRRGPTAPTVTRPAAWDTRTGTIDLAVPRTVHDLAGGLRHRVR